MLRWFSYIINSPEVLEWVIFIYTLTIYIIFPVYSSLSTTTIMHEGLWSITTISRKMQNTYPQVYEDFRNGCFAINRTSKQFSCGPVDLTMEQTIKANAACQRTGISVLINSISERERDVIIIFLLKLLY